MSYRPFSYKYSLPFHCTLYTHHVDSYYSSKCGFAKATPFPVELLRMFGEVEYYLHHSKYNIILCKCLVVKTE